jgi:hypothetical protein
MQSLQEISSTATYYVQKLPLRHADMQKTFTLNVVVARTRELKQTGKC